MTVAHLTGYTRGYSGTAHAQKCAAAGEHAGSNGERMRGHDLRKCDMRYQ